MEVKEFRQFLWRASEGQSNQKEEKTLNKLEDRKLKASISSSTDINESKQRVYKKVIYNINIRKKIIFTSEAFKYAATIIFIIAAGLTIRHMSSENNCPQQLAMIQIATKAGERKTITLPDSSTVVINSESLLSYPEKFTGKERNVSLKGEAFFKVKRNPQKPFNVQSAKIKTTVLGTSFNILESEGDVTVTVETGKVKVKNTNQKGEVILLPDEQVLFQARTGKFTWKKTNATFYSGWSKGYLYFNNINLEQAFALLEKWYNVSIRCQSPEILKRTIQSKYKNKSLEYILKDMVFLFKIKYEFVNDTTIMIKK